MSYRRSVGASIPFAAGLAILGHDTFSFVYHRFLDGLFRGNSEMPNAFLNWIGGALIIVAIVVYYWPQLKEMITGVPVDLLPLNAPVFG